MADILQLYSRETLYSTSASTLAGADLANADLRYADLRGQDLRGAVLRGACLHGANLSNANLSGADLAGADIFLAHFHGADLRGANLQDTRLEMAEFGRARIDLQTRGMQLDAAPRLGMVFDVQPSTVGVGLSTSSETRQSPPTPRRQLPELPSTLSLAPIPSSTSRTPEQAQLRIRAATRKDRKRLAFLAALAIARVSAVLVAAGILAYTVAPSDLLASVRIHENLTWVYAAAYYLLLSLGAYALAAPLRSRWYGDSGLPY